MPMLPPRVTQAARAVRRAVLARRRPLAALFAAVAVAAGVQAATAPPPAEVQVLTAVRDLSAGSVLAPGDLEPVGFAPGSVPAGVAEQPVGRTLASPLRRGEPVTDVRLIGPSLLDGHPGLVAVPVRLPDAGMAALLRVGDRIDLVATDPQGSGATVIAADVPVLGLPAAGEESGATGATAPGGRLVVVGVEPSEVTRVSDSAVRHFLTFVFSR